MPRFNVLVVLVLALAAVPAASGNLPAAPAATTATAPAALAPHRAIYDLKLLRSLGKRAIVSVRGRILYEFSGSACEGYALQFRQVSELDSGEGKVALSDLRAATWEDADAKSFRFNSQNFVDDRQVDTVDGRAARDDNKVEITLAKPKQKAFDVAKDMVFPTEHMRLIIEAARAGKTLLELLVYDGSESGEKTFYTLTVIGRPIPPDGKGPIDAAAGKSELAHMTRWPVTISYFDQTAKAVQSEQTPVYAIGFELYENGISRALRLDYGDFVVSGEMTELELKNAPPCK